MLPAKLRSYRIYLLYTFRSFYSADSTSQYITSAPPSQRVKNLVGRSKAERFAGASIEQTLHFGHGRGMDCREVRAPCNAQYKIRPPPPYPWQRSPPAAHSAMSASTNCARRQPTPVAAGATPGAAKKARTRNLPKIRPIRESKNQDEGYRAFLCCQKPSRPLCTDSSFLPGMWPTNLE